MSARSPDRWAGVSALPWLAAGCLALAGGYTLAAMARRRAYSFRGRVVVITGGSRGLGLELAREFAAEGADLALLARDERELARANAELTHRGARVLSLVCDVTDRAQVHDAIARTAGYFGRLDVLINNAGMMQVAPLDHLTYADFDAALGVHLHGPLAASLAALPHLRRSGGGRIVNIASIGGKIAVPHMLAYTASKFALVGLSDGLRAELRQEDILVTTVCPGPMRTGSAQNAMFKGQHRREYAWFAIADSMPLLAIGSRSAARRIVAACRRGAPRLILGLPTKAAVLLNELMPGTAAAVTATASRMLPEPARPEAGEGARHGYESESAWTRSPLTGLSRRAAERNNEQFAAAARGATRLDG